MIEFGVISTEIVCDDAWLYCATHTHKNKYDWRMPTKVERVESGYFGTWDIDDHLRRSAMTIGRFAICQIIPVRDIYEES